MGLGDIPIRNNSIDKQDADSVRGGDADIERHLLKFSDSVRPRATIAILLKKL